MYPISNDPYLSIDALPASSPQLTLIQGFVRVQPLSAAGAAVLGAGGGGPSPLQGLFSPNRLQFQRALPVSQSGTLSRYV
jgi:hypothetical protein